MSKTKELFEQLQFEHNLSEETRVELHWMEQEWKERNNKSASKRVLRKGSIGPRGQRKNYVLLAHFVFGSSQV